MSRRYLLPAAAAAAATLALALLACAPPDDTARVSAGAGDRTTFAPVASALTHRCGTMDCHGSTYRNFRVYGYGGLRLDPADRPDTPVSTTPAESDATYDALVSLEPELTAQVIAAKGAGVDNLTVVRKGRGEEGHKGGLLMIRNDDCDTCLVGWLSGAPNPDACTRTLKEP